MTAKIGLNIHPVYTQANGHTRAYSAEEKQQLDTFLLQAQPSTITVLNDFDWALRFANMLPNTAVSFRKQHDHDGGYWRLKNQDGTPYSPRQHFEGTKEHHNPRIRLHLTNEPTGKTLYHDDGTPDYANIKAMIDWHVGCMDLFGAAGIPLLVINWGVGLPDLKWFQPNTPEWPLVRPLFEAFKRWPIHWLGIHVYWRKNGFLIDDYVNRPRDLNAALVALGYTVQMQVSEYGGDAIDGHPGAWMDAYGNTEEGQKEYARLVVKGQRENLNLPFIRGIDLYSWACYPRWTKYDVSKAQHIQDAIINSNLNLPVTETPQPDEWATGIAVTVAGGAVVRFQPYATSKILTTIHSSEPISYERSGPVGEWWKIKKDSVIGYVNTQFLTGITMGELPGENTEPPIPLPPAPPVPSKEGADLLRIIELNDQIDAAYQELAELFAKYRPARKIA